MYAIVGTAQADGNPDPECVGSVDYWGFQAEEGPAVTSYIITAEAQVTRARDVVTAPLGAGYNPIEGTLVVETYQRLGGEITVLDLRPLAKVGNLGGHGSREPLERLSALPRIGTSGCRVGGAGSLVERPSRQADCGVGRRATAWQTTGGAVLPCQIY